MPHYYIHKLNWHGLGVTNTVEGQRCIPLSKVGDTVEAIWHINQWGRVTGQRVDLDDVLQKQLDCAQASRCPACTLRHFTRLEQQQIQLDQHMSALKRVWENDKLHCEPQITTATQHNGYRSHIRTYLSEQQGEIKALLKARWDQDINWQECPIQSSSLHTVLKSILKSLSSYRQQGKDSAFIQKTHFFFKLLLQDQIYIDLYVTDTQETLCTFYIKSIRKYAEFCDVVCHSEQSKLEGFTHELIMQFRIMAEYIDQQYQKIFHRPCSIHISFDPRRFPLRINHHHYLAGTEFIEFICEQDMVFRAYAPAWLPSNPKSLSTVRHIIHSHLIRYHGTDCVFEIGCGIGLMSLFLAKYTHHYIAVDHEKASIQSIVHNVQTHHIKTKMAPSIQCIHADARRALAECNQVIDFLIIHAMRKPLTGLLTLAYQRKIPILCYIAPSIVSLARDLNECVHYQIIDIHLVDQLPGTSQVLSIALLQLIDSENPSKNQAKA